MKPQVAPAVFSERLARGGCFVSGCAASLTLLRPGNLASWDKPAVPLDAFPEASDGRLSTSGGGGP